MICDMTRGVWVSVYILLALECSYDIGIGHPLPES